MTPAIIEQGAKSILIVCDAQSHETAVKIATFAECRDETGQRVSLTPAVYMRSTRNRRADLVTAPDPLAPVGDEDRDSYEDDYDDISSVARNPRPSPITQTRVGSDQHFHYRLCCWRCGLNVSTRAQRLADALGALLDAGVSRVSLAVLSRTVGC